MKALAALVALVAASPAWSQNSPMMTLPPTAVAPAAADQTLGAAHMFAIVRSDGTLVGGSGAVSSTYVGNGVYEVIFDRSTVGCGLTASSGVAGNASVYTLLAVPYTSPTANKVGVLMRDPRDLTSTSGSFHVMVLCAK